MSRRVCEFISRYVLALIEANERPVLHRPLNGVDHRTLVAQHVFRGVNKIITGLTSTSRGYSSPFWLTAQQALALQGRPRRGETYTPIVLYRRIAWKADNEVGRSCLIPAAYYRAFNLDQVDGIAPPSLPERRLTDNPIGAARALLASLPESPVILHGATQAHYSPSSDTIQMPPADGFDSPELAAHVLLHEACHWSGSPSRLSRTTLVPARYHRDLLVRGEEEISVEIASSWLTAHLGIHGPHLTKRVASYCGSWADAIRRDPKCIFRCANAAQKMFDYLTQAGPVAEDEAVERRGMPSEAGYEEIDRFAR